MMEFDRLSSAAPSALQVADAVPFATRAPLAAAAAAIHTNADYEGEPAGREAIVVMAKRHVHVRCVESWLSHPMQSAFGPAHLTLPKDTAPQSIGALQTRVRTASDAGFDPDDHRPDMPTEAEFTSVRLSPAGVVFGEAGEANVSSALAVTHNQGGAQIWVQDEDQSWHKRFDMSHYLHRGYQSAKWGDLASFDSSLPLPLALPSVPGLRAANQRRAKLHVRCVAWSNKFDAQVVDAAGAYESSVTPAFILIALGSHAGVVSVWKLPLPLLNKDPVVNTPAAPASPVPSPSQHPELVCSFALPAPVGVFVSQLAFSPVYFDAPRHATVCTLAVGTTNGQAHIYAIEPYAYQTAKVTEDDEPVPLPMRATRIHTMHIGNPHMSISALQWGQVLSAAPEPNAAEAACPLCYQAAGCRHDATSVHGIEVHHMLAVGCSGQLQAIAMHPNQYLHPTMPSTAPASAVGAASAAAAPSAAAAAASSSAAPPAIHPSVCRVFDMPHAHNTAINSFVWSIQSASSMHASGSLASHHIQLLSASDDDIVHRWIVRDTHADTNQAELTPRDDNTLAAATSDLPLLSRLHCFPSSHILHGEHGILRSADGSLLYTLESLSVSTSSSTGSTHLSGKRRVPVSVLTAVPFPSFDVPDEDRETFARLSLEHQTIWTGDEAGLSDPIEPTESKTKDEDDDAAVVKTQTEKKSQPATPQKSAMEIMMEQELEERRIAAGEPPQEEPAAQEPVVKMENDLPATPSTHTAKRRGRPPRSGPDASASSGRKKSTPKPKPSSDKKKKPKKRRQFGDADDDEEEDEDEAEWKASDASEEDEDDDDEEDDGSDDDAPTRRRVKRDRPSRDSLRVERKRMRRLASQFVSQDAIPIPLPLQSTSVEQQRRSHQHQVIRQLCASWREHLGHAIKAQLVRQTQEDVALAATPGMPRVRPFAISLYSLRTLLHACANPYHLSVPPSLTEMPTRLITSEVLSALDSDADGSTNADSTPFALYWRLLPRILPPNWIPGGFETIFETPEVPNRIYPHDAFAMPLHRQLPFIFLADSVLDAAESVLEECLHGRPLAHAWIDIEDDSSAADGVEHFTLRLVLSLVRVALTSRTPFIALSHEKRQRAESLQLALTQVLQFHAVHRHLLSLTMAMSQQSEQSEQFISLATALPFPATLLLADWMMQHVLGLTAENRIADEEQEQLWSNETAVWFVRIIYRVYTLFHTISASELLWFSDLFEAAGMGEDGTNDPTSTATWTAALKHRRTTWPITPKEKCPLCDGVVPLHSSVAGTCPSRHSLPRCRRSLLLLSTMQVHVCNNCQGSSMALSGPGSQICSVCWAATQAAD